MTHRLTSALLLALAVHSAHACTTIDIDGSTIRVAANRDHTAHIVLPEPLIGDRVGNKAAFETSFLPASPTHYWIKPRRNAPEDASTSLTLLTATGAIDVVVERDDQVRGPCYSLNYPESIGGSIVSMPDEGPSSATDDNFVAGVPTATVYAMKGRGVARTHDDGRFTYITLDADFAELPVVTAGTADQPEPVNVTVEGRVLRVAGIFDQLNVHIGRGRPVRITRAG
jgi:hypothetical protein